MEGIAMNYDITQNYDLTHDYEFNQLHLFLHVLVHDTYHHHHGPTDYDILIHDHDGGDDHYITHDDDEFGSPIDKYGPANHKHDLPQ